RRAAERISEAELRDMRNIIDLQRFYAQKGDSESSTQIRNLDSQFHDLLYRCSGSRVYYNVLHSLHKKIEKFRMASVSKHGRAMQSIEEHEKIYQALAAHDGDLAYAEAVAHMSNARDSMKGMEL
ncbi:MAG: FCD domain-containing protein, partial [Oscillospiraceae bacterium]|nr:FCD domain-containing protein [Oscillospiraceae bacterium]